jgi:O-antigen ligase
LVTRPVDEFVRIGPETIEARLDTYATALALFRRSPLIGNGTVYAERVVGQATGTEDPIHNKFLASLAGTGILGFVPLVLLWVVGLLQCRSLCEGHDPVMRALGVAYVVGLIGMSIQVQFFGGESLKPLAVVLGLIAAERDTRT